MVITSEKIIFATLTTLETVKMVNYFSSEFKLGILGGGQLGKMMLYETRKFDICTYVLDPSIEAPSKIACNHFSTGDLMDYDTVYNFGKQVDVLTIEIENVNVDALAQLEKEGKKVFPGADTLKKIQSKGTQKEFYKTHLIPTAPFVKYPNTSSLIAAIKENTIKFPFIWKSTRGGYDGKGVAVIRSEKDLLKLNDTECIAEELIDFKNELAVIVVRSAGGEIKTYPVVEMEFHPEANQVEYVICPARIDKKVATKALEIAKKVSAAFEHVGVLAVEMFQTKDDQILVNEVAPRPHNSGHYSIEASYTNQFEQHIRAILNLPLGITDNKIGGIMVNLVGEEGYSGDVVYQQIDKIMQMKGVTPHIYGKKQTRPFRKMGHITIVHPDINTARSIAEEVKKTIKVISKN